jgi:hypothetical protein
MRKARTVPRPFPSLIAFTILAFTTTFASAQNTGSTCSLPTAEISHISRPTGVLRADPDANQTASQKIVSDVARACSAFSTATAAAQVRLAISDNNIIVTGAVPTGADGQQLIDIIVANADGRTVFNRLEVVPLQIASRRK